MGLAVKTRFIIIFAGLQEEDGGRQEGIFESFGCLQSQSGFKGKFFPLCSPNFACTMMCFPDNLLA